ncbi:hypothetical protein D6T69_02140 [Tenacibaculum singaporense]|uniref:WG repeat protein n=2 Tax=Tenacibaculum singaporense TaxID=2358479 RepID=A0A3S8R4B4_9FLAO|nr:hypothetical protein D6T69_02140 [Tenacibaculum singaporense]
MYQKNDRHLKSDRMKNFVLLLTGLLLTSFTINASEPGTYAGEGYSNYGKSFIFTEAGVEFAVYPDGQFDFYLNGSRRGVNVNFNAPGVNISFNSGYNYDPFVQYDDYGAVVQIEDIPIFYDHYGRIVQAGDVFIRYNRWGRVARVGGLFVHYNSYGNFLNCTGYINSFNRYYVYRPFHRYFAVPVVDRCVVWNRPYRRFYSPYRYSYSVYRNNYYDGYYKRSYRNRSYYRPENSVRNFNRGRRLANARNVNFRSKDHRRTMYQRNDRNYRKNTKENFRVANNNRDYSRNRSRTVARNTRTVFRERGSNNSISRRTPITRERNRNEVAEKSNTRTSKYNRPKRNAQTKSTRGYFRDRSRNATNRDQRSYKSRGNSSRSNAKINRSRNFNRSKENVSKSREVRSRR